ncbi:hypothetical protein PYCH_07770 [Pyrococcus yayanosii CH1]|uniref:Uncharacterized protein n=1 Tax=Pyrococcus yayanosii (strain CH1 / JCM 16557) TaxID=529709 RepID=F8AIY6_PYRYC|nr:hypothetical protein PYCH_07770 [Pyrococcus yayanosii CH1]
MIMEIIQLNKQKQKSKNERKEKSPYLNSLISCPIPPQNSLRETKDETET